MNWSWIDELDDTEQIEDGEHVFVGVDGDDEAVAVEVDGIQIDQIDHIVPPGTDVGTLDQEYAPPAVQGARLRRRPLSERSAA